MSGRLIILPKKTWNVWNREAIAKVRNDEKAHQEATEAAAEKSRKLDQEARVELLRHRANAAKGIGIEGCDPQHLPGNEAALALPGPEGACQQLAAGAMQAPDVVSSQHINLFADLEHAMGVNEEHEREKRERETKDMKRSGLAPLGLGGTREERERDAPWWGAFAARGGPEPVTSSSSSSSQSSLIPAARQLAPVPSSPMSLQEVPSDKKKGRVLEDRRAPSPPESQQKSRSDRKVRKREKKKKRKKKHSKKSHSSSSESSSDDESDESKRGKYRTRKGDRRKRSRPPPSPPGSTSAGECSTGSRQAPSGPSLYELRARRLEREAVERTKAAVLLAAKKPEDEEAAFIAETAKKRYHSQFFSRRKGGRS